MNSTSLKEMIKKQPIVLVLLVVGVLVIVLVSMPSGGSSAPKINDKTSKSQAKEIQVPTQDAEQQ